MNVTEIGNKPCKLGKTSITVLNPETGKTCCVIRNVQRMSEERQARNLYDVRQRHKGITPGIMQSCAVIDGTDYYIANTRRIKALEMTANLGYESDAAALEKLKQEISCAQAAGLEILYLNLQ